MVPPAAQAVSVFQSRQLSHGGRRANAAPLARGGGWASPAGAISEPSGSLRQILAPGGGNRRAGDMDEDLGTRYARDAPWVHAGLSREPVPLAPVARGARGNDVVPARRSTLRPRDHVIDRQVRPRPAVLAGPSITSKYRTSRDLALMCIARYPHVGHQPDHSRPCKRRALRVQRPAPSLQELCLFLEQQHYRTPHRTHVDRLERRVENKHPTTVRPASPVLGWRHGPL
jgi:hypothetical protein